MKKCKFAILLCLVLLLPVSASAREIVDLGESASLTVTDCFGNQPLSGVDFRLYLISTMDEQGALTPVEAFGSHAEDLDISGKNDDAWYALAQTLEQEILAQKHSATDTAVTDEHGIARFPSEGKRLAMGLYLVLGTSPECDGYVYTTAPFFVLIPGRNGNAWSYAQTAQAKPQQNVKIADLSVIKIWEDDCHKDRRPESIAVQLMRDGEAYGEPVTLNQTNGWKHTWQDLEMNHQWTVTEKQVKGYREPVIRREGNTFRITNTCTAPAEKTEQKTTQSGNTLPQTGQLWWPVPVLLTAGLLALVIGLVRRRGEESEP